MFRTSHSSGAPSPVVLHDDIRSERLYQEHRKLANCARNIVYAHPNLLLLGDDPFVQHLCGSKGFATVDVAVMRVSTPGGTVTAICVPKRVWKDREEMERLLDIKRDARRNGTRCILVPPRWLKADIRSAVARVMSRACNTRFSRMHLQAVTDHVKAARITTLSRAASVVVEHSDPLAVVFALASQGLIEIDRSAVLTGETLVSAVD